MQQIEESPPAAAPVIHVAPAPHLSSTSLTTRKMMLDVLIGLAPAMIMAFYVFGWYAVVQVAVAVAGCWAAEAVFNGLRWVADRQRKGFTLCDFSAAVTGVILAFSLPAICPWWVTLIAAGVAIGIGKIVYGGLGQNIFNPAMVGRAFVMIGFANFIAAGGYVLANAPADAPAVLSQATPMTAAYKAGQGFDLFRLFIGTTNGSVGEVSDFALILGGLYLCIRRTASWEIPAGSILGLLLVAGIDNLMHPQAAWTVWHHLFGGAFLFGAFFIVTDPVTSPLTPKGKFVFGLLFGVLVMLIRMMTMLPEGVMFSVLLVNAAVPLINRFSIPRPLGGPAPVAVKK